MKNVLLIISYILVIIIAVATAFVLLAKYFVHTKDLSQKEQRISKMRFIGYLVIAGCFVLIGVCALIIRLI